MNKNNPFPTVHWSFPIPLTSEILQIARQFANEQPTEEKAQQVYLNTLAVCAVNNYLRILGIPTEVTTADSWNSSVRLAEDVADLWVSGKGSLECRPIKPGAYSCYIPPVVGIERIAYVVVEIDEQAKDATLRGFTPHCTSGDLSLDNLHSLESFLAYLHQLTPLVNLSQWLKNVFETGWETIETVLGNQRIEPAFAFRSQLKASDLKRCKLLKFGNQAELVALIVTITPQSDANINILIELKPTLSQIYLPANLQLILLDEYSEAIIDTKTTESNQHIQLDLSGEPGERFSIKVILGEVSVREYFIV